MPARVLFVEDDKYVREVLLATVDAGGYEAQCVESAEAAVELLSSTPFDLVVTDCRLPGESGLDLIPRVGHLQPNAVSIMMTAFGTVHIAVEAMKRGAVDFLTKPFTPDELLSAIKVALERSASARRQVSTNAPGPGVIAVSAPMLTLLEDVRTIAPFNTTVLITGETGTGKELIARTLHALSPRARKPLVALNCAAIPEQLLEDELFGHVKGAYTGAHAARPGRFEIADGGTLFLDEIGDMGLPMQSKLLRVLQEREFEKLGAVKSTRVDVRVVAATSANLERRIAEGTFREDLYYRLNVVHFRIPPLRERPDDIRPLAEFLLKRFCASTGLPEKHIDDTVWATLSHYRWPGNVRQLQNAMERAAALTGIQTLIRTENLPEEVRSGSIAGIAAGVVAPVNEARSGSGTTHIPEEGVNFDAVVTRVERDLLLRSLDKAGGNKMRAAKLLNMKRTTFIEKLKRLQIGEDEDGEPLPPGEAGKGPH